MKTILSASGLFGLDKNDFLKGLFVAIFGAAVEFLYKSWSAGVWTFDLKGIEHVALMAAIAYLGKNFITDNKTTAVPAGAQNKLDGPGLPPGPGSGGDLATDQ